MELMFLQSPLMLSLSALAILFAAVLFVLDRRRASHQARLRRAMNSFVRANARKSFSVIVKVEELADSLVPLLDNLQAQDYSQLQVIVFASASITKQELNALRRLQRQRQGILRLRIVRQTSGNERALIRRYADGEALVWLNPDDRLSKDFFTRMSLELLDELSHAVKPRLALSVDDTIRSASGALHQVAKQTFLAAVGHGTPGPVVIRRTAYLNDATSKPVSVEHTAVTVAELPTKASAFIELILILITALVTLASSTLLSYGWQIVTVAFIIVIVLVMIVRLLSYPYSAGTKLALALMIPLWPVVAVVLAGGATTRRVLSRLWKLRIRPVRVP